MASVTLSAVTKRFGPSTVALEDVDLEVDDGEFLVLLGPSGCGKSTTLRLIAGLEHQDIGTISIGGRCVDDVAAEDRDVAMVFQSYALYPHMSVRRNIAFSLRPRDLPRSERHREVERVAEQLGLTDCSTASLASCRAASSNGLRWRGRSCAGPACSSWTSRCRTSTRSSGHRRGQSCCSSTVTSLPPSSTSRTTRSRRSRWRIAWPSSAPAVSSRSARPTTSTTGRRTRSWPASSAPRR
jgi:hypothetical protein